MNAWSTYVFGAVVFLGVGMGTLTGGPIEWWSTVTIVIAFAAALTFAGRAVVEYRRERNAAVAVADTK